ncbi:MAG: acyl-CoA dehydrogenase family protein [Spirochaetes bacterium]|jgi:alkylation response protein AidB-like acyl-CoA dehydrogenase|nr:acyl-CoA dehydrogenase family protein [Spirochaetota bacterium]
MSYPDRNNPYNFDAFIDWRKGFDYYGDDEFLQRVLKRFAGKEFNSVDAEARKFSKKVSFKWRDLSDAISVPEKRPYMMHYDGHRHRIDRIVRPEETRILEREIFSEGIFSAATNPWLRLLKMYLIYQNGEACVSCPLVCTEGLIAILERFADRPETKMILKHCREGIDGDFGIGAQYLSEIQGGSDVPANLIEAVRDGDSWKLYGNKFFCSAAHADYAVVTAKPSGSEEVGLFIIPSWLPGDRESEKRNGYTIDRIKWKMGTSELPTAEITLDGAVAYQAGPLERGVANVVGIVLTYSRLTVGLSAAASMTRAAREAEKYSEFRSAFGLQIGRFPMLKAQVDDIQMRARRTTAGGFKLYGDFLSLEGGLKGGLQTDESKDLKRKRFDVRELIMLQKITAAWDCTDALRDAMSVFGGHGVMEDFSSLPRLFRDAAINELWEGPRNVLLTQMHRDFQRASAWYPPGEFISSVLRGAGDPITRDMGSEMEDLLSHKSLLTMDEKTILVCRRWDDFCHRLYHEYQNIALNEVDR